MKTLYKNNSKKSKALFRNSIDLEKSIEGTVVFSEPKTIFF